MIPQSLDLLMALKANLHCTATAFQKWHDAARGSRPILLRLRVLYISYGEGQLVGIENGKYMHICIIYTHTHIHVYSWNIFDFSCAWRFPHTLQTAYAQNCFTAQATELWTPPRGASTLRG